MTIADISGTEPVQEPAAGVPVILGIALDDAIRRRLATLLDDSSVVMFTPDVATAHAMLCRDTPRDPGATEGSYGEQVVRIGDLEVDHTRRRATCRGMLLPLTKLEGNLLAGMVAEPARVWTYRDLHATAWEGDYLDPGPVHAAVKRLRRKLQEAGASIHIGAVRGEGYELIGI
jgi:DNA-binding response OmpR family regulator